MARTSRNSLLAASLLMGIALTGCSSIRGHQGYIADMTLVDAIKPGVDNRDSVEKTLGRPTFVSQFGLQDWYYFSRNTKQLAFALPTAKEQFVYRVRFDQEGNVSRVDRAGMERIVAIRPNKDKTPTLGRNKSFLEDLFGNLGSVGAGGPGGQGGDGPGP